MLNERLTITTDGSRRATLSWTVADAALVSWVFVDGARLHVPLYIEGLDRSLSITLPAGTCRAIEVHDLDPGVTTGPVFETPTTLPELQWNPVPGAVRYRLHHREGSGPEQCIMDRPAGQFRGHPIRIEAPRALAGVGGVWHFLRIEAVDAYGNESTRASWRWFAMAPPLPPAGVEVAEGTVPGLFTITVTP